MPTLAPCLLMIRASGILGCLRMRAKSIAIPGKHCKSAQNPKQTPVILLNSSPKIKDPGSRGNKPVCNWQRDCVPPKLELERKRRLTIPNLPPSVAISVSVSLQNRLAASSWKLGYRTHPVASTGLCRDKSRELTPNNDADAVCDSCSLAERCTPTSTSGLNGHHLLPQSIPFAGEL
jgi:hypothetical protein